MKFIPYIIGITLISAFILNLHSCSEDTTLSKIELKMQNYGEISYNASYLWLEVNCYNEWKIEITNHSSDEQWCSVSPSSGAGNDNIVLSITENTGADSRSATLQLSSDTSTYNLDITQMGNPEASDSPSETPSDPDQDDSLSTIDTLVDLPLWMELPQVTSSNSKNAVIISHSVEIDSREVRNFTVLYDTINRVANWVAYPISSNYIGDQARTDDWEYDPKIPSYYQPNLKNSFPEDYLYNGSTHNLYDRGHLVPSASRTANYQTNAQTFYFTNMTAQHWYLNRYMWAKLEGYVRDWATECDTMYVVAGAQLSSPITYTVDISGDSIAVPARYFKVLLALDQGDYRSIGFVMDNDYCSTSTAMIAFAHNVSYIESLTGYNFFANLADSDIKNQYKVSEWDM